MEFRILGPLEVLDEEGRPLPLTQQKPRAVLALLLLHANHVVSEEQLVDGVWGDDPPARVKASLQNAVSRVRRAIGPVIASKAPGYVLRIDAEQTDLGRFQRLVEEARTMEGEARAAELREAVGLFRGEPLAEFSELPFAGYEGARLEALRAAALDELFATELALGKTVELVPELDAEIARNPRDERLRAHLMLALYRAGRQTEALDVYRETRKLLDEEQAVQPGAGLQRLHQAILRQDPALDLPVARTRASFDASRKTVTTLVAELTIEGADPERLRRAHERFVEDARIAVERRGGRVHEATGDTMTALFGVPTTREDDPLRAVGAALDVTGRANGAELRVAIDTGEAFVRGEAVTGEAAGNARRLIELAGPGDVVVGASTLALVRNAVTAERIEGARTRGRPVDAFRVVAVDEHATPVARNLDAPLVGRRHELARLADELRLAFSERRCRLVTLVGDAGIGKSRLARELMDRLGDEAAVLVGRCVSYGEGATYLPLAEVVRRAVASPTEEAIASLLADDDERALVAERVGALVGFTDKPVASGDAFWSVRRFVEALARERPLILFFDDVHWAEPTFLDLVEHLREWIEDAPVLLVCAARPELLDARRDWGAWAIVLGRLEADEVHTLVDGLRDDLTDADRARVVEHAEGNPLYVEQLVAAIAEGDGDLPTTIEALLAARLDRLDSAERELLQRAAVVGREFDARTLAALAGAHESIVRASLARLERRGLARSRGDAYRFHHVLVREVAYASTPKDHRAELHAQVAELVTGDELVGFHLERAYEYGVELGSPDAALAERAGERLGRAAMRAFARGDAPAATNLFTRAIALLPKRDPRAIELRGELGIVRWLGGDSDGALRELGTARADAAAVGDRRLELRAQLETSFVSLYSRPERDASRTLDTARKAIPSFEAFGDHRALGRAWYVVALVEGGFFVQNASSIVAAERALAHYRLAGFPPAVCIAHLAASLVYGPTPADEAIARIRGLLADGEAGRNGDAVLKMWLALLEAFCTHFDDARALVDDAHATFTELGHAQTVAAVASVRGALEQLAGDDVAAATAYRDAARRYEEFGLWAHLATDGARLADALHALGELDEAEAWLEKAERHAEPSDTSAQFTWRSARAKVLATRGEREHAEPLAREAVELVDSTDALNQRAEVRLALAHVLDLAARSDEAAVVREEAHALFTAKGNVAAAGAIRV